MNEPKSITKCKLCSRDFTTNSNWCPVCKNYSIIINHLGLVESEVVSSGNFYLVFFPAFKEANIVSNKKEESKLNKIHRIEMEELTSELAIQWAQKLRKYVIFQ